MFRIAAFIPCAFALQVAYPRGDYNINAGSGVSATTFPEFNVQYYHPAASGFAQASLKGDTESNNFAGEMDKVLEKQNQVMTNMEHKGASFVELPSSSRVTQSPLVWLSLRAPHASLAQGVPSNAAIMGSLGATLPLGDSSTTVNVFEQDRLSGAAHAMLLQPQRVSAPFEVMDFFVENGGGLPGAASLASVSKRIDTMLAKTKHSMLMEGSPVLNLHVANGVSGAGVASFADQVAHLNQIKGGSAQKVFDNRARIVATLQDRRRRIDALRSKTE